MAITYPRVLSELADFLPIKSMRWRQARSDEFAGLGSSQSVAIEMADPLWAADIELDKVSWKDQRVIDARLNSLEGSIRTFELVNPLARAPTSDPTGALLGASTPNIFAIGGNNDTVRIGGLPVGYWLREGDFFSVDFGPSNVYRAPFQLLEAGFASGTGITASLRVTPHVWPGIVTGLSVKLIDPSGYFFITPNSLQVGAIRRALVEGGSFSVLQRL